ncbi:hypothetical protein J5X84_42560 [Streptosporangiaceae bacterium NEAU-GS5]|nr:hypothetical protein [Streptosporangiaceae bacterium NEAU-GS5]
MSFTRRAILKVAGATVAVTAAAGLLAGGDAIAGSQGPAPARVSTHEPAYNLGTVATQLPLDITAYYANKGRTGWAADVARVDGAALSFLRSHYRHAKKPAIVLDIDDTSEETQSTFELAVNYIFDAGIFNDFAFGKKAFVTIQPTLNIAKWAKAHGIEVFFITGRRSNTVTGKSGATYDQRVETLADLGAKGYPIDPAHLITRPADSTGTAEAYKTAARKTLVDAGFKIIINVGDQLSDLNGGFALKTFKLPNPMYFIP